MSTKPKSKRKQSRNAVHVMRRLESVYGHKPEWIEDRRNVEVMATAGGYAMVRRKGYIPYVCGVHELQLDSEGVKR